MPANNGNKPLRLLYLPNENIDSYQIGPRTAFEEMSKDQTLSAYQIFSFLYEAKKVGEFNNWEKRLVDMAKDLQPNVIFWQHIGNLPLSIDLINQLKGLSSKPLLVYHEGDVYGKFRKRISPSMIILAKYSDITFVVGLGNNAELFVNAGAKKVVFSPSCIDAVRFGKRWNPNQMNRNGVVMIGNNFNKNPIAKMIPPLSFPGARQREQFAQRLYKKIGKHFKVYGSGWEKYPFSKGIVHYDNQEQVLRQHLLSVNWDHFPDIPFFFSDRLPISLLSGVAHATNFHPGYELIFHNGEHLVYYHTINDAIDIIDWLLCQPNKYLVDIGYTGEQFARKNLTTDIVYRQMIETIQREINN